MEYFCGDKEKKMVIELWSLGKQDQQEFMDGIQGYVKRLKHYTQFNLVVLDNSKITKTSPPDQIMQKEAALVISKLNPRDLLITLDERGEELNSIAFSKKLNGWMNTSPARIVFLIGGSFGIAETLHQRAQFKMSLSQLTMPHQLVRLFFVEQLYRAFTILKNEKYHHE